MKVFTLKNCDTCKKALKWLGEVGITYENHDVRADGLTAADVQPLIKSLGWEVLLNRRSTTWRGLSDADKADIGDDKAVQLIVDNPTLMKRPVFVTEQEVMAGFDDRVRNWLHS